MELRPERLASRLEAEGLKPAYLVAGEEPLLVLEAADALRARARSEGIDTRELFEADRRDFDWGAFEAALMAPGLFGGRRLLDLRLPGGKPGKAGEKALAAYCAAPPPDTVLLVTCEAWSRQHAGAWSRAIEQVGDVVIAWPLKPHELPDWIERRLHARGIRADRDAVLQLADRVQGNLLAAAQEIDKLVLLDDGQPLDAARMQSLVADSARFDVFRLVDAMLAGQGAVVVRMLRGLRAEGEAIPALTGMLARELQTLARLARLQGSGGNLAAAFRELRVWESRQAGYRRALGRHAPALWDRHVAALAAVDRQSKGRAEGDAWQALERLLLAVAEPRAAALATAPRR
jgi:DNA polymerase-3 subunit delta